MKIVPVKRILTTAVPLEPQIINKVSVVKRVIPSSKDDELFLGGEEDVAQLGETKNEEEEEDEEDEEEENKEEDKVDETEGDVVDIGFCTVL